jgi:hypothetical protein
MYDTSRQFSVRVLINGRTEADEYAHHDGNTYIEGRRESRFEIELGNYSNERCEFVLSVDGLSVIDGQPAGVNSAGFIVERQSTIRIPGWKVSGNTGAEFIFSNPKNSYTKRSGHGSGNMGVIGAMIFREKATPINIFPKFPDLNPPTPWREPWVPNDPYARPPWGRRSVWCSDETDSSGNAPYTKMCFTSSSVAASDLGVEYAAQNEVGTGFGKEVDFRTSVARFDRRDSLNPDTMIVIYYDSERGLAKRGIQVRYRRGGSSAGPNPFPTYSGPGYCKPPPGWRN